MEPADCVRAFSFLITTFQVNLEEASAMTPLYNTTFFIEIRESHACNKNAFPATFCVWFKTLHHNFFNQK